MASIRRNDKGFKLIEMSMEEIVSVGGYAVCDSCGAVSDMGVYIAVLDSWYCERCFDEWYAKAKHDVEDYLIEKDKFNAMRNMLGI